MRIPSMGTKRVSRFLSGIGAALIWFGALGGLAGAALAQEAEDTGVQQMAIDYYSSKYRVSLQEASRRLSIQDRAAGIEDRIERLLGDQYAGVWYDSADQGRLKIGMTPSAMARSAEVLAAVTEYGLGDDARFASVRYTLAALEQRQASVRESLLDMIRAGHATTGYDEKLNRVIVRALGTLPLDEEARIAALARDAYVSVQRIRADSLLVTTTSCQISSCNPPLRGGRSMFGCTAAFMARHRIYTSDLLVLTAGHCIGNYDVWPARDEALLQWLGIGPNYGGIYGGSLGIDAGAILLDPNDFWGATPPLAQVVVKSSSQTAYNPNYKIKYDAKSTLGQTLCWSGGFTGSRCAEVTALGQDHVTTDGVYLKNQGEVDWCNAIPGDSGAPLYKKNRAFGIAVTVNNSWPHCYMGYQGIRGAENAMQVDILVSP